MTSIKKYLILIVDDNSQNIQVLGKILYEKGYNINVASSGAKALQSVNIQPPDLILLDIQMPEMDGFDVCKILKSNAKTEDIPVIFLTAATDTESMLEGFKLGGVDYITKPFNNEELTIRVNMHIDLRIKTLELQNLNQNLEKIVEERTSQLREYAFITSHNLRKPLANILGFVNLIDTVYKNNHELSEMLKHLKNSSIELDNVIKETAQNLNKK